MRTSVSVPSADGKTLGRGQGKTAALLDLLSGVDPTDPRFDTIQREIKERLREDPEGKLLLERLESKVRRLKRA